MSQLETKGIGDNQVIGSKILLNNNETLRAKKADGQTTQDIVKLRADNIIEFPTIPQAQGTPMAAKDVVTVEYLTNFVAGRRDPKDAVNVASETNVALSGAATLTIDGVPVLNGYRVGLVGQTNPAENGVYVVSGIGSAYSLTRSNDFDEASDVTEGAFFKVIEGSSRQLWEYVLTTKDPITLGTTALVFAGSPTAASLTGGDMIVKSGSDFSVDLASISGLESTNPGNGSGQLRAKVSSATLLKDRTVKINGNNELETQKNKKFGPYTLVAQDVTNGYVDLADVAADSSVQLMVKNYVQQHEGIDYSVNYTGGVNSKTRITFLGDLAAGGAAVLAAGQIIIVSYKYL